MKVKEIKHDRELWTQSQDLLDKIKQDFGIFSTRYDDTVSMDIRSALIEYADYCFKNANKKKPVNV